MKEYVFVFYKNEKPQAPLESSPFIIECLNNAPLTQKFLEENINNASKKGQEFKGAILLYASEKSNKFSSPPFSLISCFYFHFKNSLGF